MTLADMKDNTDKEPLVAGGQGRSADAVLASGITASVCFVLLILVGGAVWLAS